MLGVDREDPRAGGLRQLHDQLAPDDEALLVREGEVDALGEGHDRRPEPGRPHDRVEHDVGRARRDQLADALHAGQDADAPAELLHRGFGDVGALQRDETRAVLASLFDEPLPAASGGQAGQLEIR